MIRPRAGSKRWLAGDAARLIHFGERLRRSLPRDQRVAVDHDRLGDFSLEGIADMIAESGERGIEPDLRPSRQYGRTVWRKRSRQSSRPGRAIHFFIVVIMGDLLRIRSVLTTVVQPRAGDNMRSGQEPAEIRCLGVAKGRFRRRKSVQTSVSGVTPRS